jgi:hypothetical protein
VKAALVTRVEKDRLVLTFPAPVPAMEDKTVRVQVEVRGKTPVKYSLPMPRAGLRRCE